MSLLETGQEQIASAPLSSDPRHLSNHDLRQQYERGLGFLSGQQPHENEKFRVRHRALKKELDIREGRATQERQQADGAQASKWLQRVSGDCLVGTLVEIVRL